MPRKPKALFLIAALCLALVSLRWITLSLVHLVSRQSVWSLAFSPDSQSLAAGGGWDFLHPGGGSTGGLDGSVWVWDTQTGQLKHHLTSLSKPVNWIAYSPDSSLLATWQYEDEAHSLWDAQTGRLLKRSLVAKPSTVTISIAKQWLSDDEMRNWDRRMDTLHEIMESDTSKDLAPLAISPNHEVAALVNSRPGIQVWNLTTRKLQRHIKHPGSSPQATALSPDGSILAVRSPSQSGYELWDTRSGKLLRTLKSQGHNVHLIIFSPDGKKLATENYQGLIEIWEARSGKLLTTIQAF